MPELANAPKYALRIEPPQTPLNPASYFDRTPVPAPIPSTVGLSRAQGKAQLWGSIASVLSSLPDTLTKAYEQGNAMKTGNATRSAYEAALAGRPVTGTSLSDFKATGDGGVTFSPGNAELEKAKLDHYNRMNQPKPVVPTLYDTLRASARQQQPPLPVEPVQQQLEPIPQLPAQATPAPVAVAPVAVTPVVSAPADPIIPGVGPTDPALIASSEKVDPAPNPTGDLLAENGGTPEAPQITLTSPLPYSAPATSARASTDLAGLIASSDPEYIPPSEDKSPISVAEMRASEKAGLLPAMSPRGRPDDISLFPPTPIPSTPKPMPGATPPQAVVPSAPADQLDLSASRHVVEDPYTHVLSIIDRNGDPWELSPNKPNYPQRVKPASPKIDRDMQKRINEANENGANISVAGKTSDELAAELAAHRVRTSTLSDAQINHVTHLRDRYASMPIYHNAQNVIDGFHNATLAAQQQSGIGDKTLIEEGQRVLNPGSGVRVQTIQMFGGSSGLMERLSPSYIASHFEKGIILTPGQRKEYLSILDKAYRERIADMDEAAGQHVKMAKSARVPEEFATGYFDNPYKVSAERNNNPPGSAPAAAPTGGAQGTAASPVPVATKADYDKLPSGTWYVDKNGKLGVKP